MPELKYKYKNRESLIAQQEKLDGLGQAQVEMRRRMNDTANAGNEQLSRLWINEYLAVTRQWGDKSNTMYNEINSEAHNYIQGLNSSNPPDVHLVAREMREEIREHVRNGTAYKEKVDAIKKGALKEATQRVNAGLKEMGTPDSGPTAEGVEARGRTKHDEPGGKRERHKGGRKFKSRGAALEGEEQIFASADVSPEDVAAPGKTPADGQKKSGHSVA